MNTEQSNRVERLLKDLRLLRAEYRPHICGAFWQHNIAERLSDAASSAICAEMAKINDVGKAMFDAGLKAIEQAILDELRTLGITVE